MAAPGGTAPVQSEAETSYPSDRKTHPTQEDESVPASPASHLSRNTLDSQDSLAQGHIPPLHDSMPPPAYSASVPTQDPGQAAFVGERIEAHHSGYGAVHRASSAAFPHQSLPEDMGGTVESTDQTPLLGGGDSSIKPRRRRKGRLLKFCLITILFVVIIVLIVSMIVSKESKKETKGSPIDRLIPAKGCGRPTYHTNTEYTFDNVDYFHIIEHALGKPNTDPYNTRIYGDVALITADSSLDHDMVVDVSIGTYDKDQPLPAISRSRNKLEIAYDTYNSQINDQRCIAIFVEVRFNPSLKPLRNLDIELQRLGFYSANDFRNEISGRTRIKSFVGDIRAGYDPVGVGGAVVSSGYVPNSLGNAFTSGETVIDLSVGSFSGHWSLVNLLDISIGIGEAEFNVLPKPQKGRDSSPAVLAASVRTGSIEAHFDDLGDDIPDRDYQVDVVSDVADVRGSFIHGTLTNITLGTGNLDVLLTPLNASASSKIETVSYSGDQRLEVAPPLFPSANSPLRNLISRHYSYTGDMNFKYRGAWEGSIEGVTSTGKLTVRGKEVEIIKEKKKIVGKYIEAKKGDGDSHIDMTNVVGSITLTVEDSGKPSKTPAVQPCSWSDFWKWLMDKLGWRAQPENAGDLART